MWIAKDRNGELWMFKERVFLSPEPVEGFPENYNYMKEWGFK